MQKLITTLLLLVLCTFTNVSRAAPITSNILPSPTVVDFSQFVGAGISGAGAIQVGGLVGEDIEFSGVPNTGLHAWNGHWTLGGNGSWHTGRDGYIGHNDATPGTMVITFNDGPVAGVGALLNHNPDWDQDLIIEVFDMSNSLLETYNVTASSPISTAGQNQGGFRGFLRGANDIHSFRITGRVPVIDDLAFTRATTAPEPGSIAIWLALSSAGVFLSRRRRW